MRRIVHGAVLAAGVVLAAAGCGKGEAPDEAAFPPGPAAAVLTPKDVPAGYLPAQVQPAFRGVAPHDPHCRRLLELADGKGLHDVPMRGTAFYRISPGATLTQHVFAAGAVRADKTLTAARRAAARCAALRARVGGAELNLPRTSLSVPDLPEKDTLAVRFAERSGTGHELSYELVMYRSGGTFLVVAQPGVVAEGEPSAAVAAAKLAAARLLGA